MLDSKEIRRRNLLVLISEAGTAAALAEAAQTSAAYLSQILSVKTKAHLGDALARKLEAAMRKPHGWMDTVHYESVTTRPRAGRQTVRAYEVDRPEALTRVPVIASAEASRDGDLKTMRETSKKQFFSFPASAEAYALRIRGDNLRPRIKNGEYLIVDPEQEAQPGDDVIITLKRTVLMMREYLYRRDDEYVFGPVQGSGQMLTMPRSKVATLHAIIAILPRSKPGS